MSRRPVGKEDKLTGPMSPRQMRLSRIASSSLAKRYAAQGPNCPHHRDDGKRTRSPFALDDEPVAVVPDLAEPVWSATSLLAANILLLKVRDIGADHSIQRRLGSDEYIEVLVCDHLPWDWGRVLHRRDNRHLDER